MKLDPGADCFFKGGLSCEQSQCRFTSQTPPPFSWGCSFLLPQSTSIIQGYKCVFIHIRACHRSRIIHIKHSSCASIKPWDWHADTERFERRETEGTALTETLYPHLCFAKLFRAWLSVLCWTIGRFQAREWISNDARGLFGGFISVWFCRKKTSIHDPQASALVMGKLGTSCFF